MMRNPAWKTQNGGGCLGCPVDPCLTLTYRGSTCTAQRAKLGLGDPLTHADRIRAMSDEELAKLVGRNSLCEHIQYTDRKFCEARAVCENCIVEWLQQPVKGEST